MGQALFLSKKAKFSYEPLGVVGVIAPWNYPWSIPFDEVAIALMAGNGVVLKPASLTPLLGERIRETFEKAGLPEGLVRVVHGGGAVGRRPVRVVGAEDLLHRLGRGGPQGRRDLRQAAEGLGARARRQGPADRLRRRRPRQRDLRAASGAGSRTPARPARGSSAPTWSRRSPTASSRASCAGRSELTVGDPLEWETEIGPMVSEDQFGVVTELVDDALEGGAERLAGGPREVPGFSGKFIAPTVLAGVEDEMRIMREEIFGPVVPIIVVDSEEEALGAPTTPSSASAPRSGPRTAPRASGWRGGSSPGWCGSTTTPTPTAPASARGAASRSPASAARTRSSASTSA